MHWFGKRGCIEILEHLAIVLTLEIGGCGCRTVFFLSRLYDNCQRGFFVFGDNRTIVIKYVFINW